MVRKHDRLVISLATAVLLSGGLAACGNRQAPQVLISEAQGYLQKGEPKAAIIQLKNVLQKNPDNVEARSLLGKTYAETGDPASAEKELRKALSLGASQAELLPVLGKAMLARGQYQQVLDEVKAPAGASPDARFLAVRGDAYLASGKRDQAQESFDLALKQNPDMAEALVGSARLALLRHDNEAAASQAERATAKNPADVDAWLFKGDVLRIKGELEQARAAYAKAIELKPDRVSGYIAIAMLQINARDFAGAAAQLDAAKKHAPHALLINYTQSLLEFRQGKYAAARDSIQQVLRYAPDHMPSVLLAGAIQYALGSTQEAEQNLKKFLERNPDDLYAARMLAAAYLKNGETTRAIKTLEPLLADGDKDPELLALAGDAYMRAKNFSKATEYFEKASALAPKAAAIRTALGVTRLAQGENARGIAELELATSLDPKPMKPGILLVLTHMRLREFDQAIASVEKLQKVEPDNPLLFNLKGGAYLAKGSRSDARASFEKALALQANYFPAVANLAQMDVQEHKPEAAKKRLAAFLDADKKSVPAMTALAGVAFSEGHNTEATTLLERAANVNPDDLKPSLVLAAAYLRTGQMQKALAFAQKLQTSNPEKPEVLDLLGQTQIALNDRDSALQTYKKLVALNPGSAFAHYRMAGLHAAMGKQAAAEAELHAALTIKPDYLEAQQALAAVDVRKGDYDGALKVAREIQKQPQEGAEGHQLEGDILMAQKKPEPALKAYEKAFSMHPSNVTVVKMHQALARAGQEKEGESRLLKWLKDNPSDLRVRMYLADAYLGTHQGKSAIGQYEAILQADPKNAGALNNLAIACQQVKDPRATQFAEKAFAVAPGNPSVMDTLGWLLVEQGNTGRGLPLLQKAAALAPASSDIRLHLAHALQKAGNREQARTELEKLLASGAAFPGADEAKALLRQLQ